MKEYLEFSAKTVDEAITKALLELEIPSDRLDYEIVEKGSSGILGMFTKPAVIRVVKPEKDEDELLMESLMSEIRTESKSDEYHDNKEKKNSHSYDGKAATDKKKTHESRNEKGNEYSEEADKASDSRKVKTSDNGGRHEEEKSDVCSAKNTTSEYDRKYEKTVKNQDIKKADKEGEDTKNQNIRKADNAEKSVKNQWGQKRDSDDDKTGKKQNSQKSVNSERTSKNSGSQKHENDEERTVKKQNIQKTERAQKGQNYQKEERSYNNQNLQNDDKDLKLQKSSSESDSYSDVSSSLDKEDSYSENKKLIRDPEDKNIADKINIVKAFLTDMFNAMNMNVEIDSGFDEEDKSICLNLSGDEMGILIGKRGQTLDSIQYLCSLVVNKGQDEYIRVKVDTENYRQRRKETLENLARNIAYKVRKTKKPVSLEPMNPYERRIIHSALQNDKYVVTRSEGVEPYRHVVISPKNNHGSNTKKQA